MEKLLTPADLAQKIGLAVQTIYNRRANGGSLPRCILIGQFVRFAPRDVDVWLAKQYEDQLQGIAIQPNLPEKSKRRGRPTKAEQIKRRNLGLGNLH
ncbi:helix-turn-helix transcriptional regulator [Rhodoferax antarcticus]|jgi:predicted DNA-binding transcriptional regulator AlpA|uniref:helix-turn-helix transcriptional regulator n=1 Tax=Rhodoferax antarcticus TaxID=81479 RepID=UPI00222477E6|nr:helix-turn-helix domain-containing protein [Rhodoferax antarcticus]MCW2314031.1 putative DNA-binding transcriptional regulator AlpA [Rhodoferax antarcticus]